MIIKDLVVDILYRYHYWRIERKYVQNIKEKLKQCDCIKLTKEQKKAIQDYYKPLINRRVPTYWHQYFYSRNGVFDVKYIPTSVYQAQVVYRLNYFDFRGAYVDKGFYDTIFADVNRPKTIVKCVHGYFYTDNEPISKEKAYQICSNLQSAVIKPSIDGKWGEGVFIFSSQEGKTSLGITLDELFELYDLNFIIQEKIVQHSAMSELNPTSINTLRVLTYRNDDGAHVLYCVVRIGRDGQYVDNETAGGINADVDLTTGKLIDCAYGTPAEKRIEKTDIGTKIDGFQIPSYEKVFELAKSLHLRLPYFNLIGWDFTIDEKGEPVLIEFNRAPDLSQTAHGPAFGEFTEEIMQKMLDTKNSRKFTLYRFPKLDDSKLTKKALHEKINNSKK